MCSWPLYQCKTQSRCLVGDSEGFGLLPFIGYSNRLTFPGVRKKLPGSGEIVTILEERLNSAVCQLEGQIVGKPTALHPVTTLRAYGLARPTCGERSC